MCEKACKNLKIDEKYEDSRLSNLKSVTLNTVNVYVLDFSQSFWWTVGEKIDLFTQMNLYI